MILETICPYPEPPTLYDAPDHLQGFSGRPDSQSGNTQTSDQTSDHPHTQGHRQLNPPNHISKADVSRYNSASDNPHGERSKNHKRKTQRSRLKGRTPKRTRVPPTLPTRENSFTDLCSHFISLTLDECLQFLFWLFEGALPRCMPDTSSTICKDGTAQSTCHPTPLHEIEQNQGNCSMAQGSSRKGMQWSEEEEALLKNLKKEQGLPWSEVASCFVEQFFRSKPGFHTSILELKT